MAQNIGSTLTVNNYFGVLQAVLANLGIGVLPDYLTADHKRLVRVLPNTESGEVPVFLAYPEELRQTRRVAVFRDFVLEEIQAFRRRQSEALLSEAIDVLLDGADITDPRSRALTCRSSSSPQAWP